MVQGDAAFHTPCVQPHNGNQISALFPKLSPDEILAMSKEELLQYDPGNCIYTISIRVIPDQIRQQILRSALVASHTKSSQMTPRSSRTSSTHMLLPRPRFFHGKLRKNRRKSGREREKPMINNPKQQRRRQQSQRRGRISPHQRISRKQDRCLECSGPLSSLSKSDATLRYSGTGLRL